MDSDSDFCAEDPYRYDPPWEERHANAVDVQGGPDADTSSGSDSEDESKGPNITLPDSCICANCRYYSFRNCIVFKSLSVSASG